MSLSDNGNGNGMVMPVGPMYGNGMGFFGGEGGLFYLIILFFFFIMFGAGWGNGYGGGNASPYIINNAANDVQRGFDQAAVMGGINGITTSLTNGFSNAEISRCNSQANILQAMNTLSMGLQNCCCENRAGLADLKYTVATEACADRQSVNDALNAVTNAMNAGFQGVYNQMCQDKIDAKNEEIARLRTEISLKDLAASQTAQTSQILADNSAQTAALERYLNPAPIPAYVVQNPNGCNCGQNFFNSGCGC